MKVLLHILQTVGLSITFVFLLKAVIWLRFAWLRIAIRIREKYNEKHGFSKEYGIGEIDTHSLSYQIDSVKGIVVASSLFLLSVLLILFLPTPEPKLFSILAFIITVAEILYCWIVRYRATKTYCILVYISSVISSLLYIYALFCLSINSELLVTYSNSINTILYIWSTMIMYRLILDRKPNNR